MSIQKIGEQATKIKSFVNSSESFDQIMLAYREYKIIAEQEKTKRKAISAWQETRLAEIQAQRDFLIGYLEKSLTSLLNYLDILVDWVERL